MPKNISLKRAALETFSRSFPFLKWLPKYNNTKLRADFVAGLTVAVILIPQAMAYAMLAGLPPVYGLYAALFGAAVGSLWGSSAQLATGPVAIVSFLVLTTLIPLAEPGSPEFIALAIALAMMVGVVQLLMGVFRLGFIMRAIPNSVLIGFSSAAAIIIAATQIPNLFGFAISRHEFVFQTFIDLVQHVANTHLLTLGIGLTSLALMMFLKKNRPAFPAGLLIIVIGIAVSYALNLSEYGVAIVGSIPSNIPFPSMPDVSFGTFTILIGKAFVISIIGFMEAYAIAKTVAADTKQKIDINQELVGQGLANMVAGLFKGYPVTGSFSRTAVNHSAGAVTGMSGVFVSIFVALALLFLTPFLYYLPQAILAAIVIAAVVQLINTHKFMGTYKIAKADGGIAMLTFLFAFILKPDDAVLIGVVVALAYFFYRTIQARVRELGVDKDWQILKSVGSSSHIETYPNVLIARIEMSLFYANVDFVVNKLNKLIHRKEKERGNGKVKMLVLDFEGVNYIDATGVASVSAHIEELANKGVEVYAMYIHEDAREVLDRAGMFEHLTEIHNIKELKDLIKSHNKKHHPKLIK